jgi:hypothetical protein
LPEGLGALLSIVKIHHQVFLGAYNNDADSSVCIKTSRTVNNRVCLFNNGWLDFDTKTVGANVVVNIEGANGLALPPIPSRLNWSLLPVAVLALPASILLIFIRWHVLEEIHVMVLYTMRNALREWKNTNAGFIAARPESPGLFFAV